MSDETPYAQIVTAAKNAGRAAAGQRGRISLSDGQLTNRIVNAIEENGVSLVAIGDLSKSIDLSSMNPEEFDIEEAVKSVYRNDTLPREIVHLVTTLAMDRQVMRDIINDAGASIENTKNSLKTS